MNNYSYIIHQKNIPILNAWGKIDNFGLSVCLECSENKEKLNKLLSELYIYAKSKGIKKHFINDTDKRQVYEIIIKRNNQEIKFNFGCSVSDTKKNTTLKNLLYDILCSCKNEYFVDKDYYNQSTINHSQKLQKIFSESEIEYLPE